jgi:hypothetical protein
MAKNQDLQNTGSTESNSFSKGMNKDLNEGLMSEGSYIFARNAVNNSKSGDLGVIGNESSNDYCASAPYTIIGTIHIVGDRWAIFSTDDTDSEIGTFDESDCSYKTLVNDPCLAFKKTNLIIGESKERFDCSWEIYWADNLNPDRSINEENPPWVQIPDPNNVPPCNNTIDSSVLNCERLRMARLTEPPCVRMEMGTSGGELLNGTYQAVVAYTENEQRISDYSIPSNAVSLFDHRNVNGSLDVIIDSIDETYDEFELVIMGFVNQNLVARKVGIYSTHQKRISIDKVDPTRPAVPLRFIPLDRPAYEKSEGIYKNGDYLIRTAPTSRFSFNYQPLANTIKTQWVAVEYEAKYYRNAGVNVGYLRDEVYSFFIRWIYNTYDKSESYHIPGRAPGPNPGINGPAGSAEDGPAGGGFGNVVYGDERFFEAYNTASALGASGSTNDGGTIVAKGPMGYWESSEIYPDNKPDVWGDLCGVPIRHHKMPDNKVINHFNSANLKISVLGVQFDEIPFPIDNQGAPIPGIIGYEILRGSREGNKTVVAKGLLNNMGSYTREDNNQLAYYQNYPYNDLNNDPFLSTSFGTGDQSANVPLGGPRYLAHENYTFHSPDTQFKHPFLSSKEVKTYSTVKGVPTGTFAEPEEHPKFKFITNSNVILSSMIGFGIAMKGRKGEERSTTKSTDVDYELHANDWAFAAAAGGSTGAGLNITADALLLTGMITATGTANALLTAHQAAIYTSVNEVGALATGLTGGTQVTNATAFTAALVANALPGMTSATTIEYATNGGDGLPYPLRAANSIPAFAAQWGAGTQSFIDLIKAFSKAHHHATAYRSHCFHNESASTYAGERAKINDATYLNDRLQEFGGITVNNLYRNSCVALALNSSLSRPAGTFEDRSRFLMSDHFSNTDEDNLDIEFQSLSRPASAHYVGLKARLRNQYGQVDGIAQLPTGSCMQKYIVNPSNPIGAISEVIFGGDTYIGRYTEKNTMPFFFNWLENLPDGTEIDYRTYKMMPFPTYWMDTKAFQINEFLVDLIDTFVPPFNAPSGLPSSFHNFDRATSLGTGGLGGTLTIDINLIVTNAFMYLFSSGVRDFFVESEVNVEYRDWGDTEDERHYDYDNNTDYFNLFNLKIIKSGNFYKYDYSLSASRYYQGYSSWGAMQFRNYDPELAETCYTYYPKRVIYSLLQTKENRYDNWLIYLINNYRDFTSKVTTIKPIAKNGAMMLFDTEAPLQFIGVDTLQTDAGTKITLGDGGLFNQALQNIVNADDSYEYGSCQNRMSVINTPAGLFWISQNQGKIFNYGDGLTDITQSGMKWWFDEFLPYKLLEDFPNFELQDNTVIGIGCQSIYDNSNTVVYFTKRDFKLRPEFKDDITYLGDDLFQSEGGGEFRLGDPRYFDSASWTVSYDPKAQAWISFHDWHPNFMLPSKNNFCSIANAGIWKHNSRSDNYCNFYGINYPFEMELVAPTGQNVNTLKSIEYLMEVYVWDEDGVDKNHVLDFNFDRAVVYNTEQMSGELRLNLSPKNNAPEIVSYPIVNPTSIDILYSKVEQKYRFNQFWDITDDRGEFTNARRMMWLTGPDGYKKEINPAYVNYAKVQQQRKKFRHYQSNLLLKRRVSGAHNMQLKIVNSKKQYSMR